ncbi:allophanate hydrolase subunit 1 [Amycolatopsis sp. K13G38]|uniref:Allophanate hydrolase subunit 1 n=1 Tax=Amycolatopsis acididurans TaxID=2724524 RepID=A0ABX1J4V4_9PSEU|nr:allophanate hydrolase subunit 1 [Amycolatopsis acididurans]NKQ54822.1 allophanate hydrolase subunit 1 [Amycolatopsis acididurans]
MKVRACGDRAVLAEVDDIGAVLGLYAALRQSRPDGIVDLVPAARTLLVRFEPRVISAQEVTVLLEHTAPAPVTASQADTVTIPVRYDGEDLAEVAERTGLDVPGVIDLHSAADYVVAFGGFAPGFGYLTGLDPKLHLPRRAVPRTRVPIGSVAIAGEYAGVYPRSSPGGWHLLGRTEIPLWDTGRTPPALLAPGTRVRFEAT